MARVNVNKVRISVDIPVDPGSATSVANVAAKVEQIEATIRAAGGVNIKITSQFGTISEKELGGTTPAIEPEPLAPTPLEEAIAKSGGDGGNAHE